MTWQIATAWAGSMVVVIGAFWAGMWKLFQELRSVNVKLAVVDERLTNHIASEEKAKVKGA